ncbi:MAG TPA: hypothetical protein VKV96_12840 [Roseiarcus sp.]|nr:hypothetical protein [Roseiarcus sp.]
MKAGAVASGLAKRGAKSFQAFASLWSAFPSFFQISCLFLQGFPNFYLAGLRFFKGLARKKMDKRVSVCLVSLPAENDRYYFHDSAERDARPEIVGDAEARIVG